MASPRSLVPVAVASATRRAILRVYWLGAGPLFHMPAIPDVHSVPFALGALIPAGAIVGLVAASA